MTVEKHNLQPTLWRTCRVLANRTRLKILQELFRRPDQTVSQIARRVHVSQSVASVYLRALNARGLIHAEREGACVRYRVSANDSIAGCAGLVSVLNKIFAQHFRPVELIFRQATAFTHPRRIAIIHALQNGPLPTRDIRSNTGISHQALNRHIRKLAARGFVFTVPPGIHRGAIPGDTFSRELLHLIRRGKSRAKCREN